MLMAARDELSRHSLPAGGSTDAPGAIAKARSGGASGVLVASDLQGVSQGHPLHDVARPGEPLPLAVHVSLQELLAWARVAKLTLFQTLKRPRTLFLDLWNFGHQTQNPCVQLFLFAGAVVRLRTFSPVSETRKTHQGLQTVTVSNQKSPPLHGQDRRWRGCIGGTAAAPDGVAGGLQGPPSDAGGRASVAARRTRPPMVASRSPTPSDAGGLKITYTLMGMQEPVPSPHRPPARRRIPTKAISAINPECHSVSVFAFCSMVGGGSSVGSPGGCAGW